MFKNLNAFMLKSYLTIPVVVYNIIISTIFLIVPPTLESEPAGST